MVSYPMVLYPQIKWHTLTFNQSNLFSLTFKQSHMKSIIIISISSSSSSSSSSYNHHFVLRSNLENSNPTFQKYFVGYQYLRLKTRQKQKQKTKEIITLHKGLKRSTIDIKRYQLFSHSTCGYEIFENQKEQRSIYNFKSNLFPYIELSFIKTFIHISKMVDKKQTLLYVPKLQKDSLQQNHNYFCFLRQHYF
eukprot:TRINITY_DN5543_c0_g3_i4.p1 TRINITY_DN5543_c0_g3~~TRINITY_DN5543_c0_g3_i4.p1  ORF type:complete len:210 (+),score=-24.19 TRINITY_DN5543_c0_g3_i4:53-631(+)